MLEAIAVVVSALVAIFAGTVGYLLQRRDNQQEERIADLYRIHESDAKQLQALELKVAQDYHNMAEIEGIVRSLKEFLNEKFKSLEESINSRRP